MTTTHIPENTRSHLSRLIRCVIDKTTKGWTFVVHVGPGAGYGRWILGRRLFVPTGWTLWIGRNVKGGGGDIYRSRPWSMGFSRNGNCCPWPTGR